MVHASPGFVPGPGDELTVRALPVFFSVLELLLRGDVTIVAEAAFHDRVWRPRLEPFQGLARLREDGDRLFRRRPVPGRNVGRTGHPVLAGQEVVRGVEVHGQDSIARYQHPVPTTEERDVPGRVTRCGYALPAGKARNTGAGVEPDSDSAADLMSCPRCGHAASISTQAGPDRTRYALASVSPVSTRYPPGAISSGRVPGSPAYSIRNTG